MKPRSSSYTETKPKPTCFLSVSLYALRGRFDWDQWAPLTRGHFPHTLASEPGRRAGVRGHTSYVGGTNTPPSLGDRTTRVPRRPHVVEFFAALLGEPLGAIRSEDTPSRALLKRSDTYAFRHGNFGKTRGRGAHREVI